MGQRQPSEGLFRQGDSCGPRCRGAGVRSYVKAHTLRLRSETGAFSMWLSNKAAIRLGLSQPHWDPCHKRNLGHTQRHQGARCRGKVPKERVWRWHQQERGSEGNTPADTLILISSPEMWDRVHCLLYFLYQRKPINTETGRAKAPVLARASHARNW